MFCFPKKYPLIEDDIDIKGNEKLINNIGKYKSSLCNKIDIFFEKKMSINNNIIEKIKDNINEESNIFLFLYFLSETNLLTTLGLPIVVNVTNKL